MNVTARRAATSSVHVWDGKASWRKALASCLSPGPAPLGGTSEAFSKTGAFLTQGLPPEHQVMVDRARRLTFMYSLPMSMPITAALAVCSSPSSSRAREQYGPVIRSKPHTPVLCRRILAGPDDSEAIFIRWQADNRPCQGRSTPRPGAAQQQHAPVQNLRRIGPFRHARHTTYDATSLYGREAVRERSEATRNRGTTFDWATCRDTPGSGGPDLRDPGLVEAEAHR